MPKLSPELLLAIWDRASTEELGISIEATDPTMLRAKLLEARKTNGGFDELMTFCPEGLKEVFIVKKTVELPDAQ